MRARGVAGRAGGANIWDPAEMPAWKAAPSHGSADSLTRHCTQGPERRVWTLQLLPLSCRSVHPPRTGLENRSTLQAPPPTP